MPLKTKNAYRTLPLSVDAIDVLMQQRRKTGNSEWVFPSPTGGPMSPDSVLHMLHRVLKRAGLPKVRFHDLRHTFATMALQNGVDIKTVSGMLGHFSAGFTLDTYRNIKVLFFVCIEQRGVQSLVGYSDISVKIFLPPIKVISAGGIIFG
ncbi:tyrosine-type recombinase/integrase, partial [Dysosmobacter sp.]|uniref:tyrosine-type recombinase/integrase n=2 Tax=Eubacteriales TaxID=186802 RepID=UPI003AB79236